MTLNIVGGVAHETNHREQHAALYLPLLRFAFGDPATWGTKRGCVLFAGEGREAAMLAPFMRSLIVTDGYPECLDLLRVRFKPELRVQVVPGLASMAVPDIPTGSVDCCTALVALMHIGQLPIRRSYAEEIVRILAPGGVALVQMMAGQGYATSHSESYGHDVGFETEQAAVDYWSAYLPVAWVLRTPPIPRNRPERCWWWLCLRKEMP